ncbi:MAG: hypothetical protein CVU06_00455 [Bacteroidetes bacterium HGW-Bacteroidetes-22]|nr:MAG: hypothetical protein CVU06_00455 [Bacteroidetes bacterium HGW-Bacteroidetes-22]
MIRRVLIIMGAILISAGSIGQTAKSQMKAGKAFVKAGNQMEALSSYTKAIELDPNLTDAYVARAQIYESMKNYKEAIADYDRATAIEPKEFDWPNISGRLNVEAGQYEEAVVSLRKALQLKGKDLDATNYLVTALIGLKRYDEAITEADRALVLKKTPVNYYNRGRIYYLTRNFGLSEGDFRKALDDNPKYLEATVGLAQSLYEQKKYVQALGVANDALKLSENDRQALLVRARVYHQQKDYMSALTDMARILTLYPDAADIGEMYFYRATLAREFNQHTTAIADLNHAISLGNASPETYYLRGVCYEDIFQKEKATADYLTFIGMTAGNKELADKNDLAHKRVFDLNKESDKPTLTFTDPVEREKGTLDIIKGVEKIELRGKVIDESAVKYMTINGKRIELMDGVVEKNNTFTIPFEPGEQMDIVFEVSDVYDNVMNQRYVIRRTEIDPPVIYMMNPMASDNGELFIERNAQFQYFEGTINDESLIASVTIDGVNAGFNPSVFNPTFSANIDLLNKDAISVVVTDILGNVATKKFTINRDAAAMFENNPMGKTWLVFIENSEYKSLSSLQGPSRDVTMMRNALANYQIHNIIHKKNMTHDQMQRFFAIELRDFVLKNHVSSLIIWYAGHGKYYSNTGTGYWIPVDGTRDDEFSYFNTDMLKGALQPYQNSVNHLLIVTDACEAGPSFFLAMRSSDNVKADCHDWKVSKARSAQVLSSAGYELAVDNSTFTSIFAKSLLDCPMTCISIDEIAQQVIKGVGQTASQKPRFGQLQGFKHEGGTFFFMKKTD